MLQYLWLVFKKLHSLHDQVVKIQGIVLLKTFLIFFIHCAKDPAVIFFFYLFGELFRCFELVFCIGNRIQKGFFFILFCVYIQVFADILHQTFLVICIIDRKTAAVSDEVYVSAQDPYTGGVEGTDPDTFGAVGDDLVYPFPHFTGCLVGKGQCQDLPGIHLMFFDQIGNAVGKNSGLAGTCSCQDQ